MKLLLIILIYASNPNLGNVIVENKCKDELFLKPYVILKQNKNGPEVAKVETQGVIDLREAVQAYVCINGAVILYNGISIHKESQTAPSPNGNPINLAHVAHLNPGETIRFSNGTFKIFSHACMRINQIPTHEIDQMKSHGKKPSLLSNPTVHGAKVTGIYLLTTKEPYDPALPPLKIMLNRRSFGYKIGAGEHVIKGASFLAVGKGPYCLSKKDGSMIVLSSKAKDDKEICRWSLRDHQEADMDYKKLFKGGQETGDFTWEDCPSDIMNSNPKNSAPLGGKGGNSGNAPEDQSKPFAIINPNSTASGKSGKYAKNSASSGNTLKDPTISSEEAVEPVDPNDATPVKYFIDLSECALPPAFNPADPLCEFVKPDNFNCEKLSATLELNANDPKTTNKRSALLTPNATPLTLTGNPLLQWKQEVLSLVATIFSKICSPFRKQSIFQLMNVIGNYIAVAHTADPANAEPYKDYVNKSTVWDILISSLNRCLESNKTTPLKWEWSESVKVPGAKTKNPASAAGKRRKRDASGKSILKTLLFHETLVPDNIENDDSIDDKPKLIIQRSTSIFDFEDDDESTNDVLFREIPRWKRQAGTEKLALPFIQEYTSPAQPVVKSGSGNGDRKLTYEDFMFHPDPSRIRIKGKANKQIFYYEDFAQYMMDLNKAIDSFWKVLSSVMGFCQMNEISRGNAIYPLLLHNFEEYFLNLIKDQWKNPTIEQEVEMVLGEFMDGDRARWLDTCMETSYIVSDSLHFRSARPLEVDAMESDSVKGGGGAKTKENTFVQFPENVAGASGKYFARKKI